MKRLGPLWLWVVAMIVISLISGVALRYISIFSTEISESQEVWGQFGDYFGGILNPILSFCAFLALLFTLHEQRQSSKDNEARHEEQTREQRFFQMIHLLTQSVSEITINSETVLGASISGREATHSVWSNFSQNQLAEIRDTKFDSSSDQFIALQQAFVLWRHKNWASIGRFIETFFTLFSYVYWILPRDREFANFALGFLKSNLSESERLLLWYAAICTRSYSRYCTMLRLARFVEDIEGCLDDPLRSYAWELNFASTTYWNLIENTDESSTDN